jgi:TRAP-type C4-dicarboxylate transport system substrate-binding protein
VGRTFIAAVLVSIAAVARAEPVVLKLGTLAPAGSPWHEALREMAARWEEVSGGQVKLRVYPGGVQGNEGEMLRKLAVGQLQAAALSNVGVHDLVREPQVFSVPLLFADDAEMACVFERERPALEAAFRARGFDVLQWSRLGTASLFCNAPFRTPAELANARIFAWDGDPGTVRAWRAAGLRPVVLSSTDLLPALGTRMIDCVTHLPIYMLTSRAFERASYHHDVPWGHLVGATLVRTDAWERIPGALRARLLGIAAEVAAKIESGIQRLDADARKAMAGQGLVAVSVVPAEWRSTLERSWPVLRGEVVPAAFFDEVKNARDACRARASRSAAR